MRLFSRLQHILPRLLTVLSSTLLLVLVSLVGSPAQAAGSAVLTFDAGTGVVTLDARAAQNAVLPGTPGTPGGKFAVAVKSASRAKAVTVTITCPSTCRATAKVALSKKLKKKYRLKSSVIGSATKTVSGKASFKITIKKWARQRLARKGVIKATVKISVKGGGTLSKGIKLKP